MSIHSSLRVGDSLKGERSVFTRIERLAILKKAGKFDDESGVVHGLPKVRTRFKVVGAKKEPKAAAAAAPGGTVAAPGKPAAPAAGAKAAAPAAAAKKK
ncbi:MAG: small basic protein [Planctomycetes bacterium]|nr:small basic protein [Planctomycetota bacterium]